MRPIFTVNCQCLMFVLHPVTHPHSSSHPPINHCFPHMLSSNAMQQCTSASHLPDANLDVYTACVCVCGQ